MKCFLQILLFIGFGVFLSIGIIGCQKEDMAPKVNPATNNILELRGGEVSEGNGVGDDTGGIIDGDDDEDFDGENSNVHNTNGEITNGDTPNSNMGLHL